MMPLREHQRLWRRPSCPPSTWLLSALAAFACGGPAGRGGATVDELPHLAATEVQRIGSVDDPDVGFARIGSVDVDRDGNVYVLEAQDMEIRVYGSDGALLRTIGRRGEGPGEFSMLAPSFQVVGDTVWTMEPFTRRMTLFDRRGTVLATSRVEGVIVPLQDQDGGVFPRILRPDGRFVGELMMYMGRRGPSPVGKGDTVQVPFVLLDFDGRALDTLGLVRRPPPDASPTRYVQIGSQRATVPRPPNVDPLSELLADGRIVVDRPVATDPERATFTVTRLTFAGDTVYSHTFAYRPEGYGDALLDSIAARRARAPAGAVRIENGQMVPPDVPADQEGAMRAIRAALDFPPFQPPVQGASVGADQSLWLRREEVDPSTYRWLVLDPKGTAQGLIELPRETRVLWSRGMEFWAAVNDELGVPWLVRYRLAPEAEP